MKIFPQPPKITLYKEGFTGHDQLDRKKTGQQLSALVEGVDDPLVIAVDGGWGSGKTVFLQCWAGAHQNEFEYTGTTVYLDAFQTDFYDDPLFAVVEAIAERFERDDKSPGILDKAKSAAVWLARPAARMLLAALTSGASEMVGAVGDGVLKRLEEEGIDAIAAFNKASQARKEALEDLRVSLNTLTRDGTQKLIIIVDELDRCRPDYAIAMLEIIKHLFRQRGVHFVLGVNLRELSNTVTVRYGSSNDKTKYLEKFIDVSLQLPVLSYASQSMRSIAHQILVHPSRGDIRVYAERYLEGLGEKEITIRTLQRISVSLSILQACRKNPGTLTYNSSDIFVCVGLVIIRHMHPELYEKAKHDALTFGEMRRTTGGAWEEEWKEAWEQATSNVIKGQRTTQRTSWLIRNILSNFRVDGFSEFKDR